MQRAANDYIQLLSSLPRMPRQLAAEYHPLTEISLSKRLQMLSAGDQQRLGAVREILQWPRLAKFDRQEALIAAIEAVLAAEKDTDISALIRYRLDLRTLVAALTARQQGRELSGRWSISRLQKHIETNWHSDDFALGQRFPWLSEAARLVSAQQVKAIEQLVNQKVWANLQRSPAASGYQFSAVVVYVLQWDLITRQQAWHSEQAQQVFAGLLDKLTQQAVWQEVLPHETDL